ncbi:MAG: AAA family ATPase, partial [Desulfobacterales bacterium]
MTIIRTKLHRTQIHGVYLHRQHLIDRLDRNIQRPLTLVSAPAGYGKSTLISCWLETCAIPNAWVALDENDNDLRLFLSYFLAAVQTVFPDIGRQTLAMVNASTLPPVAELAGNLINEIDRNERPFILVLDDFQSIQGESVLDLLTQFLRHPPQPMHLVLIGRRDPYLPISTLRAHSLVTEIRTQDLRFNEEETAAYLTQALGVQVDASTVAALAKKTEGWVTGLHLATLSMRHRGDLDPRLLEPHVDAQYVMEYLFVEVFSVHSPELIRHLLGAAILDRFCGPLCEALSLPGVDPSACGSSGWEFIDWLKKENMFIISLDANKQWFRFHHLFKKLLFNQLKRHFSSEDIKDLHAKASDWFAAKGLIEEALKHAMAGGNPAMAARLIARHGFELLNEEQWPRLERWLGMLPRDMVDQDPELLVLFSWLHTIYSRYPAMASCLNKADALLSARKSSAHTRGNLDALYSFQHYLSCNGERALTLARRACGTLPRQHRWARVFAYINRAGAHQMLGNRERALATIENAMRDPDLSGGISQGYFQANPCFIYWLEADLQSMLQTAAQSLKATEDFQAHQAIAHGLYFMGIAHYHRNELQAAEEKLVAVLKDRYSQHAWNFAHSAFALALIHQARSRTDEASQVGESVISYGIDTKNPAVLQIARAFRAELAIRQGLLAEASNWAEHFVAKPFVPMYRFYVPQLTLARVLLAQDTTESREHAADLLKELYNFVVSTHNKRFQTDVLALQALLYNSRGERSVALESLTHALQLAEPGGFIRAFVDFGPPMADLLKGLKKQNAAVDYIERILAAFRAEEQAIVPRKAAQQPLRAS